MPEVLKHESLATALLLTHLQNPSPNVPLQTLIAALSHHLVVDRPTPTPLVAASISSPFFLVYPPKNERLQGLVTAFRHALHFKYQALIKNSEEGWNISKAMFSKGVEGRLKEWLGEIVKGLQGGRPALRLACCTGLLLGLKALDKTSANVEDEVIIALAEVMDDYSTDTGDWEREFSPNVSEESLLSLTLIMASQSLPLVSASKLKALSLSSLANYLTSAIASTFQKGEFLKTAPSALLPGSLYISPKSSFAQTVARISASATTVSIAGVSKLTSIILQTLIDSPPNNMQDAHNVLETFYTIARRIENDWRRSKLAGMENEDDVSPDTKEIAKSVWLLLKTFLFSLVMVADNILAALVYVPPQRQFRNGTLITPETLARTTLKTLFHLSFVISKFGGVTTTAANNESGFTELRRVFYLALDIFSFGAHQGPQSTQVGEANQCEAFVKDLVTGLNTDALDPRIVKSSGAFDLAKTAYTLACIEQLVPFLGTSCLKDCVWELCLPYLSEPSHRETYESAHSVILTCFSSHLKDTPPAEGGSSYRNEATTSHGRPTPTRTEQLDRFEFIHRMVPYYAHCLVENSRDGRLSTSQLQLAYAALLKGACSIDRSTFTVKEAHQLGWYAITVILDAIKEYSGEQAGYDNDSNKDRLQRLKLALISTLPSLPLPLMIQALEEIRKIVTKRLQLENRVDKADGLIEEGNQRKELVDALYSEITERVGDYEKEAAMRWWFANQDAFLTALNHSDVKLNSLRQSMY